MQFIIALLRRIIRWLLRRGRASQLNVTARAVPKFTGKGEAMIDVAASTVQDIEVAARPADAAGNAARVESFQIVSDNDSVVTGAGMVTPDENGNYTARCIINGIGQAMLTVSADADLGEGVETVAEQIEVTVSAAKAANLGLTVTAVPKS